MTDFDTITSNYREAVLAYWWESIPQEWTETLLKHELIEGSKFNSAL